MLELAIKYRDELQTKLKDTWFVDKYKFWNASVHFSEMEFPSTTWEQHDFVSVDKNNEIIGYIGYDIHRIANYCHTLSVINFTDNMITFSKDFHQVIFDIFLKFNFNKLTFNVVIGNPIETTYDRLCLQYGGKIIGIFEDECRLQDNRLYDQKFYEIKRENFIKTVRRRFPKTLEKMGYIL